MSRATLLFFGNELIFCQFCFYCLFFVAYTIGVMYFCIFVSEGQLGYTSVDTQPTPRRVSSLKSKVVAVAAANKHTAVVTELGEVFTWGCNKEGQLGYGTSNSGSNYIPRVVEYLKGKVYVGVAAAKYHTIVLGADGEVIFYAMACNLLLSKVYNKRIIIFPDLSLIFVFIYRIYYSSLDKHVAYLE